MSLLLALWKSGKTASRLDVQAGNAVHNLGLTSAQVCVQAADRVLPRSYLPVLSTAFPAQAQYDKNFS